jgi:hypothetical protein
MIAGAAWDSQSIESCPPCFPRNARGGGDGGDQPLLLRVIVNQDTAAQLGISLTLINTTTTGLSTQAARMAFASAI